MKTFIIAEAGVNHNGSIDLALKLVDAAAEAGADAVKFQTFKAAKLATQSAEKAAYQIRNTGEHNSQYEMLKSLELDESSHQILIGHCAKKNIQFLSTPFDEESLDLLVERFRLPLIKIPSGEITNAPFLLAIARKQKPVILSTGMSTLGEVEVALGVLAYGYVGGSWPSPAAFEKAYVSPEGRQALAQNVTLLHCTSEYPAPFQDVNLNAMETLRNAFQLPVGYSDHTVGIAVSIAAVALGAGVVEKHFTLDREFPGPDHKASLEPDELRHMVSSIRQVEVAMGSRIKGPGSAELENRLIGRKSLVASKAIQIGEKLSAENLSIKRPGTGISPIHYWTWLDVTADRDYVPDELIKS